MAGGLNIWEILWQSGPVVKAVLVILVLCSVMSWAIIIQKYKEIKLVEKANALFLTAFQSSTNMLAAVRRRLKHESRLACGGVCATHINRKV